MHAFREVLHLPPVALHIKRLSVESDASDLVLGMRVQGLILVEFSYVYVVLAWQVILGDDFA